MINKNCLLSMSEENEHLFIRISGEIDHHSAVGVRNEIDSKIMELRPKRAVMDLSGIDFMDSSGLGLIMGRFSKMRAVGGELTLLDPSDRIMKIFVLAGLEKIVKIEFSAESKEEVRHEN